MFIPAAMAQTTAAPAAATAQGTLMSLAPLVVMIVIIYFLMLRPQIKRQKEHKALLAGLQKGDEIVTTGGVMGRVSKVTDTSVTLEISNLGDKPVEMLVQKAAVQTVLPKNTLKAL